MKLLKIYLKNIYEIFMSNWKQFLLIGIVYLLIFAAFSPTFEPINDQLNTKLNLIDNIKVSQELIKWLAFGLIAIFLITTWIVSVHNYFIFVLSKILDKKDFNWLNALKSNLKYFWKILLFSLIELLAITFGIVFLLLPGIYSIFVFHFALPIMANENLSIWESIKKGNKIFKQNLWKNVSLILLLKVLLLVAMFFGSFVKINGLVVLADWFITSALIYLIIYSPIKQTKEIKDQNE